MARNLIIRDLHCKDKYGKSTVGYQNFKKSYHFDKTERNLKLVIPGVF